MAIVYPYHRGIIFPFIIKENKTREDGDLPGTGSKPSPKAGHCDTGNLLRNKHSEGLHIPGGLLCSKSLKSFLTVVFLLQSYSPTVFERYNVTLQMQGKPVHLQIWDTAGRWEALGAGKRRGAPVNRHWH